MGAQNTKVPAKYARNNAIMSQYASFVVQNLTMMNQAILQIKDHHKCTSEGFNSSF